MGNRMVLIVLLAVSIIVLCSVPAMKKDTEPPKVTDKKDVVAPGVAEASEVFWTASYRTL